MTEEKVREAQETGFVESQETHAETGVDKIYGEMKRWKERAKKAEEGLKLLNEKEDQIAELTGKLREVKVGRALVESARRLRAVDPDEVGTFLSSQVALGEDLEPVVIGAGGEKRLNKDGRPLGLDEFVSEYLSSHPHHVMATGSKGGGTEERASGVETMGERIRSASSFEELEGLF